MPIVILIFAISFLILLFLLANSISSLQQQIIVLKNQVEFLNDYISELEERR